MAGPEKVAGGLLHRMWRVDTTSGAYAVKQLNAEVMKRPNIEQAYIRSESIAAAYAEAGVPAIPAIMDDANPLHRCGNDTVMIYEWFEGSSAAVGSTDPGRSFKIGTLLASLHKYQPDVADLEPPSITNFGDDHWRRLLKQAYQKRTPWISEFESVLADIISLSVQYSQAAEELRDELVISHRDMDQKNVLWTAENKPAIIDWEAAGLTNPAMELFDGAVNWSRLAEDDTGLESFDAYIRGYQSINKGPRTPARAALLGVLGNWMEWLEFNIRRSLSDGADAVEKKLGESEVFSTIRIILSLHDRFERLIDRYETSIE